MIRYHLIVMEKAMKKIFFKKRNIFLARLFLGQLPLLVSTYLFLSRQFLNFSVVLQFLLVVINLASILVTVYLTREMRIRKFYQQLIAYIGAVLCLLIMLLLIWGLKYYKK